MSAELNIVIPAYLGWGNAERDTVGLRLYATDQEPDTGPRWDQTVPGGRVAEYAVVERFGHAEGDRFLIVRIGDRFLPDAEAVRLADAIDRLLAEGDGQHG